jgi:hypothetical protein
MMQKRKCNKCGEEYSYGGASLNCPECEEKQFEKTLGNSDINGAKKNAPDIVVFGDGDAWMLICKPSSQNEGWMKTTKAMKLEGLGVVIQSETQQRNQDGSYSLSQSQSFVPGAVIIEKVDLVDGEDKVVERKIIAEHIYNQQCRVKVGCSVMTPSDPITP